MKACLASVFVFLTSLLSTFAQPGGGGGIRINVFLDRNNNPIAVGDTNFKVKTFLLSGEEEPVITRQYFETEKERQYRYGQSSQTRYYVPPYILQNGNELKTPNQCLELIYKGDTMVLQLLGISTGMGNGYADIMDTIKILPALFRVYCGNSKRFLAYWRDDHATMKEREKTIQIMNHGLTDSTYERLFKTGLLEQRYPVRHVVYPKGNHNDTFPAFRLPLYVLPLSKIAYSKDSSVSISTTDVAMMENSELLYRFVLDYVPPGMLVYSAGSKKEREEAMEMNKQINRFYNALRRQKVFVNNQLYTGTLKVFYPFRGIGIDWNAGGYNMNIIWYKKGIAIEVTSAEDVSPDDEKSHPRLTLERR